MHVGEAPNPTNWGAGLPCIMQIISLRFEGVILATLRGVIMFLCLVYIDLWVRSACLGHLKML